MANSWRDDRAARRREDQVAAAEVERIRQTGAVEADALRRKADIEVRQAETELADKRRRERRKEQQREQDAARARRDARLKALRSWAAEHMVDLMIYPLAVVSAVMAVPAMAHFGQKVYNSATGAVLPVITELGMWAFAFAVEYTRHKHPGRPVWALQLGMLVFTGVGGALNYLDGAIGARGEVGRGVVMAVVSIAGVVAHQLVKASPRRSRAERHALRVARHTANKIAAVRRAVIEGSVARVDGAGDVVLMFRAGDYMLAGKRKRKRTLDAIAPVGDTTVGEVDRALADMIEEFNSQSDGPTDGSIPAPIGPSTGGPIDRPTPPSILAPIVPPSIDPDPAVDQSGSTPPGAPDRGQRSDADRGRRRGRNRGDRRPPKSRSIEDLRAALKAAIADGRLDPEPSAESIRRTLRISPDRARELRDNPNG